MKIHDCEQGSDAWHALRASVPTASEFDNFITLTGELRTGEMLKTYLARKVAESWLGGPLPGFQTWDAEQGKILEQQAIPRYELDYREEVRRVGFVTDDAETVGCSPDGLLDGAGLEIKCLQPTHHIKCLLAGTFPKEFDAQVQASLFVTGLPEWKLFLYSRQFPPMLFAMERNEALMSRIGDSINSFRAMHARALECLTVMNGGFRPIRPANLSPERVRFSWEQEEADIIP